MFESWASLLDYVYTLINQFLYYTHLDQTKCQKCFSPKFIAIHNRLCIAYNSLKHDCSGFANCSLIKTIFSKQT
ncbi:hypothetical protein L1887_13692 [Cichorium endivia]|nr:hypothetical protein L1887_13692 [Cichorium endivia]